MNLPVVYKLVFRSHTSDEFFSILTSHPFSRIYRVGEWTETRDPAFSLIGFSTFKDLQDFAFDRIYGYYSFAKVGDFSDPAFVLYDDWRVLKCVTDSLTYYSPYFDPAELQESWYLRNRVYTTEHVKRSRERAYSGQWHMYWPLGTIFCTRILPIEVIDNDNIAKYQYNYKLGSKRLYGMA